MLAPLLAGVRLPPELRRRREETVQVGREPSRERVVALDHLEHRLLLAEQVLLGPGDDADREVVEEPGLLHLDDGAGHRVALAREARLQADERLACSHRERRDRDAFHDLVRVAAHDGAVLERSRLTLGCVAHDVARPARGLGDRAPLPPGRETRAAATAQAGAVELVEHRARSQLDGTRDARPAAAFEVAVHRRDRLFGQEVRGRHASPSRAVKKATRVPQFGTTSTQRFTSSWTVPRAAVG